MQSKITFFLVTIILVAVMSLTISGCVSTSTKSLSWPVKVSDTQEAQMVQVKTSITSVKLAIADGDLEREQGLSGLNDVPEQGMFFVIDPPDKPVFWMKDMHFSIDIVWLREGQIIQINEHVKPEPRKNDAELTRYTINELVDAVIEVPTGKASEYGLWLGSYIEIEDIS